MSEVTANQIPAGPGPLDQLVRKNPIKVSRSLAWGIMILLAAAVIWTYFINLPQYSVSEGFVVPQSQITSIQHLEGGIIQEIFVGDDDTVKVGDPLLQINLAGVGINREELQSQLDGLILLRARLNAEVRGRNIVMPKGEAERQPQIASSEVSTFNTRRSELKSTTVVHKRKVEQARLAIKEFQAGLATATKELATAKEKLTVATNLFAEQLLSKNDFFDAKSAVDQFVGQISTLGVSIPKAEAALDEARELMNELAIKFRREAETQRGDTERKIAAINERLKQASEQRLRTEITSPIDGIVKNLAFNTKSVVKPGEPIMQIVPTDETLLIEVHLDPASVGNVQVGQYALVKVTSYDFIRYGGLDGKVSFVSPDSELDNSGNPYFLVRVLTEKSYLGTKEGDLPISPGMQASADIQTGSRTVMQYLVRPVLKIRYEAFTEK